MRDLFRKYLDSRLEVYRDFEDAAATKTRLAKSADLQMAIWSQAISASRSPGSLPETARLLLPAVNDMIDITTTRTVAAQLHPPAVVYGLMLLLALVCSTLAGYSMALEKQHSWLHIMAFAVVTVISVYTFLEIEYPRAGAIRLLSASDQILVDLREGMK